MRKKRIISFLLTLVMVASLFPTATTFANEPPLAYVNIKADGIYDGNGTKKDTYEGLTFTPATASTPATLTMEGCSLDQGSYYVQDIGGKYCTVKVTVKKRSK